MVYAPKLQFNPSTLKTIFRSSANKALIANPFAEPCSYCGSDQTPYKVNVTFSGVPNLNRCFDKGSSSFRLYDMPDLNTTFLLQQSAGNGCLFTYLNSSLGGKYDAWAGVNDCSGEPDITEQGVNQLYISLSVLSSGLCDLHLTISNNIPASCPAYQAMTVFGCAPYEPDAGTCTEKSIITNTAADCHDLVMTGQAAVAEIFY